MSIRVRRFVLVWLVSLCGLAGSCAFGGASAGAAVTHKFLSQVTEVPAGAGVSSSGPLVRPQAVAGDAGALYVTDGNENDGRGEGRLDKFDASSGALLLQFATAPTLSFLRQGVAVAHGTGEVYVGADEFVEGVPEGAVAVFDATGALQKVWKGLDTPAGGFGCFECAGPGDVAVDDNPSGLTDWAAGDVYVAASAQGVVDVFEPKANGEEEYLTQISEREAGVPLSAVFGVAVDSSTGDVLVVDADGVDVFEPTVLDQYVLVRRIGETEAGSPLRNISGVAVDGVDGDVYVADSQPRVIDQFSTAGAYLGVLKGALAGAFGEMPASLAVDPGTHEVYVGDGQQENEAVDVFGEDLTIPDVTTVSASGVGVHSATLSGTVDPDAIQLTDCRFDYGTSTAYGQSAPCAPVAGAIPADSSVHPVSTALAGLAPDTTYHFRLQASNGNGTNVESEDREFTTPGPGIHSTSAVRVTSNSATLEASIDPDNTATTYFFQYGTGTAYGSEAPGAPGAVVGSGKGDVEVAQSVSLTPGTVYHFRVVVRSEVAGEPFEEAGPDETFTTQSGEAAGLLDGRAWEMVSPPNKHGAALEALSPGSGGLIQAAQDGDSLVYLASAPVDGDASGNRSFLFTQVLSQRGPQGWVSRGIATPNETPAFSNEENRGEYKLFSPDLSAGIVEPDGGETPLSPAASEMTPYRREADGEFTPLVTAGNVPPGTKFGGVGAGHVERVQFAGASADLSHVVLESPQALTPGFPTSTIGRSSIYEWSGGSLLPVSVLPDGQPASVEGASFPALGMQGYMIRHAISDDGSRIVWSLEGSEPGLYLRDMRLGKTVQLDAVEAGARGGNPGPIFQTASSDGSKVFFVDGARLTRDATSRSAVPDLYMCEVGEAAGQPTCRLKDLSVDSNPGEAADVQGIPDQGGIVLGAGEDGRYVYFAAAGALAPGAKPETCSARAPAGSCNLYVYDTVTGARRLVAVLSGEDHSDWEGGVGGAPTASTVRVSPDGRYLAFMSQRSLTGYDNRDADSGQPDAEVFLYDADTGHVVCASCNPSSARPVGVLDEGLLVDHDEASEWVGHWLAGSIPGAERGSGEGRRSWYQPGYLSDSGRLFFNAADALVRQDTNGREDVYEYEPAGLGGCQSTTTSVGITFSEAAGGCVGLISSGTSGEESALLDASESGDDVFFLTASRLAPQDIDGALDVYDAHVCTGASPCLAGAIAAPPVPCASGDACRAPGVAQPEVFGAPSSTGVSGAGNLAAPVAGKPVVKAKKKVLSRAQKLASALRVCHRKRARRQRLSCEAKARRLYGKGVKAKRAGDARATSKGNR